MTNPATVLGFLDLGHWNPSLALVMAGAIMIGVVAFSEVGKRTVSLIGVTMQMPTRRQIDWRLWLGSLLFGTGWGIGGFCPGPALVALGMGEIKAIVFVAAMLVGMGIKTLITRILRYCQLDRASC
jgi:hypothetical protein